MPFQTLGLDAKLLKAIAESGFTTPTAVQAQSIPPVLDGRDVMACAQTGTGKTAAFVLPTLHRLMQTEAQGFGKGPRVLVLTPTRELAAQIHSNIQTFSKYTPVSSTMIIGGVAYAAQIQALKKRQDIVIATPGRLIDHMESERIDFSRVEVVILDEADRMLDMGFAKPIEAIFGSISNPVQTLLFSATFDAGIEKIAARMLKKPVRIQLASSSQNHDRITQVLYRANDVSHKNNMLRQILQNNDVWQAIIFTATKHNADRLAKQVSKMGHKSAALHGDMRQNARKKVIEQMHKGSLRILVATDVAARGLDLENLSHVLNYDLPMSAEDYIHRIGRTGRGTKDGIAISFVNQKDMGSLRGIERLIGKRLEQQFLKGAEPTAEEKSGQFDTHVEEPSFSRNRDSRPYNGGEKSRGYGDKNRSFKSDGGRSPSRFDKQDGERRPARRDDAGASPYRGKASAEDLQTATLSAKRPAKSWSKPSAPTGERSFSSRSDRPERARTDRPFGNRTDKPTGNWGRKSADAGSRSEDGASSSWGNKPRSDKPTGSWGNKPASSRSERSSNWGEKSASNRSDKPTGSWGNKPASSRSERSSNWGERSTSSRSDKPTGSWGDKPASKWAGKSEGRPSAGGAGRPSGKPGAGRPSRPEGGNSRGAGASFQGRARTGGGKPSRPQRHGA